MARSRTERIGTIFSRTTSLLRAKALTQENLPIWYNIYKAFPPEYEPRFDRVTSNKKIINIFYTEDRIRAKFHEDVKVPIVNLKSNRVSETEMFLTLYNCLLEANNNDEEKSYTMALEKYNEIFNTPVETKDKSTNEHENKT